MFDENQNFKKIVDSEEKTDMEIALELIKYFNRIEDSSLVRFKKKAKEMLVERASMARESMTNPLAIKLLNMRYNSNLNDRR
jgi:hypothetical protein